jgi:hypothetical protein
MKQAPHPLKPVLMWALLSAVIFFAVAWLLGKLFNIESLHEISKFAFYISALAFLITNPLKSFRWAIRALDWLYHARPLSSLLKDERQAVVWSLFIAEAVCVSTYLLAKTLESDALRFVATVAFLVVSPVVVILSLPLVFRCSVRAITWLFGSIWCSLLFLWRCYRWLNFRRIIYLSLGFCGLVLLFYAEEDVRGWLAWQRFKHEWEAKGERFDYASVIPPPVPDDQNFALTPVVASCYESALTRDGKRITSFRTNVVDELRMNVNHIHPLTVSQIQPTNGDWELGKMCDLASWQMYYRTAVTNEIYISTNTPWGKASFWIPSPIGGSMLTNDFALPPKPQSPATDVLLALSKYDSTIEELRKASSLPYSRFPLNYDTDKPYAVLLMHLAPIKSCIQVLNLRAIAELENNQGDKALDDVKLALRLIDATRVEPSMVSQYQRTEELKIELQAVWEGLNRHKWSDAQLAAIEQELGKLDFLADGQLAMRGERNTELAEIDYLRRHRPYHETERSVLRAFMAPGESDYQRKANREEMLTDIYRCLAPSGSFYQNMVIFGNTFQQWSLNTTDPVKHEAFPQTQEAGSKFIGSLPHKYSNSLARDLLPGSFATTSRMCHAQETTDLARTACALERYRLADGEYPETLDALAPQFIDNIPHDIIGGKPLHYRRTADGKYLLYSVGWNEVDDAGKIGLRDPGSHYINLRLGDWVWPCP